MQSYNLKTQKLEYNNLYSPAVESEDGGSLDEDEKKELYGPIAIETSSSRLAGTEILPLAHRSVVLRKIMESQGLGVKFMQSKIERRTAFLDKLAKQKVLDYKSFTNQLLEYLRNEK